VPSIVLQIGFIGDRIAATIIALIVTLSIATPLWGTDSVYLPVVFPRDSAVIDARLDCGAKGDGIADDTAALQKALDLSCGPESPQSKVIFIPAGTYRLTGSLIVNRGGSGAGIGPWVYGQSRDSVILRLDDGVASCTSVIRTHPSDEGASSANWFMRNIRHLTIDVGKNPQTDGIRFAATNTGVIQDVRIIGEGNIGIHCGFIGETGPSLVQDVEIEGFQRGIVSQWSYGQTLSRIRIRRCRELGVYVVANVVGIEDLVVEQTPQALFCDYPNDWTWWSGVVSLVGGRFETDRSNQAAIRNRGTIFVRDVTAEGYATTIDGDLPEARWNDARVDEYAWPAPRRIGNPSNQPLAPLPIKREPILGWESDPTKWCVANDFGAVAGDGKDDRQAFQDAIDAAAREGKTTVAIRGVGGADPNWYQIDGRVELHGSVRHVIGLGFARVLGGEWVVGERAAPVVKFQHLYSFGGKPPEYLLEGEGRTIVVESAEGTLVGAPGCGGEFFATDLAGHVRLQDPRQSLWARQLNPEGTLEQGLVVNRGGKLWVMGTKSEGSGTRFLLADGSRSEIFAGYQYATEAIAADDLRPVLDIANSQATIAAFREVCFNGQPYVVKLRYRTGDTTESLHRDQGGMEWSLLSTGN
jgi:hypothetical protein